MERTLYQKIYQFDELHQVLATIGIAFLIIASVSLVLGSTLLPIKAPAFFSIPVDLGFRTLPAHRLVVLGAGLAIAGALFLLLERTRFGVQLRAAVDNRAMAAALGINMDPLFGVFSFDFFGRTGFWYVFIVLILVFFFLRRVMASPFGLATRGIHQSPARMRAIGTPVYWRLVAIYTLADTIAGIAGALSAQVTELVSLEVFGFSLSVEALIMLILGGTGRLYGPSSAPSSS